MSDKRIKPPRSFFRTQKRKREEENKTQGNELIRMLHKESSQISNQSNDSAKTDQNEPTKSMETEQKATDEDNQTLSNQNVIYEVDVHGMQNIDVVDPSTWPYIISKKVRE